MWCMNDAIRMNTSRRKLNPSGSLTSYKTYLNKHFKYSYINNNSSINYNEVD